MAQVDWLDMPWVESLLLLVMKGIRLRLGNALLVLSFGLSVAAHAALAQDGSANPDLVKLQQSFEQAYARLELPITRLNASYGLALKRLFKEDSSASRLDSALQIKAEIEGFGDGSKFSDEAFEERSTENAALAALRRKYRNERERLRNLGRAPRAELLGQYQGALDKLKEQQTKSGAVEMALMVRQVREALDKDVRFVDGADAVPSGRSISAQVHFVAKGDIEFTLNGGRLSYRNVAEQRKKYVDGTVRPTMIRAGDVLQIRMRSQVVFRSLIIALESEDGDIAVPIQLDDYRYLGVGDKVGGKIIKPEEILQITERPALGEPDHLMADMWTEKKITATTRDGSEWIKIGPSSDWHTYVVVIRQEMLIPVPKDASAK